MLITPMSPNTIASPTDISRRIDASDAPWKRVSTVRTSRLQRSIWRIASAAASRSARDAAESDASFCRAGAASNECRLPRLCAARTRTAASLCASRISASASSRAWRPPPAGAVGVGRGGAARNTGPLWDGGWARPRSRPPRVCRRRRPRDRPGPSAPPETARGPPGGRRATPPTTAGRAASSGLLLVRPLVLDPVAALVRARVLAPRPRLAVALRARDDLELAVLEDLADEHGAVRVLVVLVHLDRPDRRRERLTVDGCPDLVHLEALGLLHRLPPDVHAELGGLHRVVGHAALAAGEVVLLRVFLERLHELRVRGRVYGLEVVPRREVADERRGVHAAQLVLGHAVRHD